MLDHYSAIRRNRTEIDPLAAFRDAILAAGLVPPDDIVADGQLHRFASDGRARDDAGWYRLFPDEPINGVFGCWRTGVHEKWFSKSRDRMTFHERRVIEDRQVERQIEVQQQQAVAAQKARELWDGARPGQQHPYLERKRISAHMSRVSGGTLAVPVYDEGGVLVSIQMINVEGDKRFIPGGRIKGCSSTIPGNAERHIICEGFATGATLAEVSGDTVHVAFTANNLMTVAKRVRASHPSAAITVAADDDFRTEGNPGISKGQEAARACGGRLAIPVFQGERGEKHTDFNDLFVAEGAQAVMKSLSAAQAETSAGSAGSSQAPFPNEWSAPVPLPLQLPEVKPFSADLLPDALRPWLMDISDRMQCPPDFAAVGCLVVLSSLVGARVRVQPKEFDDWQVTPNLWGLTVGLPGVMKSPALAEVMRPLHRLEDELRTEWQVKHDGWEIDQRQATLTASVNEKKATKLLHESADAKVSELLAKVETAPEPVLRRFIVNDTSVEALGEVLEQNPWGILAHRDEIYGLLKSMDREGQEGARAFYLQAFDGDKPYTVDRIGRGLNRRIPCVCVSMLGSIQPGRIGEYVRSAVQGGGGDDGLIQRFQLAVWPDVSRTFRNIDRHSDAAARDAAVAVYQRLANLPEPLNGAAVVFRFAPDSQVEFNEWRHRLEERIRSDEMHAALQSHLSKYRKLVPALALIFELVDGGTDGLVHINSLLRALRWAEYLESHAIRLYHAAVTPQVSEAQALLRHLHDGKLGREFSVRDVYQKGWKNLSDPDAVRRAVALLIEYGWIGRIVRATGGRRSELYIPHPAIAGATA